MEEKPTFWVRDVPVYGDTILAPMARFSDVPYRAVCRAYGSAMNYTEFVSVDSLLGPRNPMWRRLDIKAGGEKPMVFQIFGYDTQRIVQAAQRIEGWGADIIDINMGCSVPQVCEQGAGVGMMRNPKQVADVFGQLSARLSVPVTGKIRLGWDASSRNYLEIARIMEENGAALIAVHGRTKVQGYGGEADWEAIAALKQAVSVPVIGNGDVKSVADIGRMKAATGCEAVMVGRVAIGNPWIFAHQDRGALRFTDITAVIRLHLQEMLAYYGEDKGLLRFRPHLRRYFSGLALKRFMLPMLETVDLDHFEALLQEVETAVPTDETLAELRKRTYFPKPDEVQPPCSTPSLNLNNPAHAKKASHHSGVSP